VTLAAPPRRALIVRLSAGKVRHVRTPEGSRFFDLPIGAPITAHQIEEAERRHGQSAPPDSTTEVNHPFAGHGSFKVGTKVWHVPAGSEAYQLAADDSVVVKSPDGQFRVYDGTSHYLADDITDQDIADALRDGEAKQLSLGVPDLRTTTPITNTSGTALGHVTHDALHDKHTAFNDSGGVIGEFPTHAAAEGAVRVSARDVTDAAIQAESYVRAAFSGQGAPLTDPDYKSGVFPTG